MDLKDVWQAQKERADKPDWRPLAKGAGFVQGSCPIEDDAVTMQGLRFRATAHICAADKDVPFQTGHYPPNKKAGAFARFDWPSRSGHGNKGIGPPQFSRCRKVPPAWAADRNAGNSSACAPRCIGRGHRPGHSAPQPSRQPGAQSPRPAPAPTRRALLARRVGRWPAVCLDLPVYGEPSRTVGGNAVRFLAPPGAVPEDQSPDHQPRFIGRGHRPCHSATLIPGQPGAQSPRPAPAPPPAGASRPPGRALASCCAG
jgi:hypothetical protein